MSMLGNLNEYSRIWLALQTTCMDRQIAEILNGANILRWEREFHLKSYSETGRCFT